MSTIRTAAILIIGDEILNGKIQDTNSNFFSKLLFSLGVEVKKILVIGDDSNEIIDSVHRLTSKYDFIITSGGIGPTHDDITYESIAEAYKLPLKLHQETVERMNKLRKDDRNLDEEAQKAQHRMATFPSSDKLIEILYLHEELWVPIIGIDSKVYILPGVPQLFQKLLVLLVQSSSISERLEGHNRFVRYFIKTELSESEIAPLLTSLQIKSDSYVSGKYGELTGSSIKIGSYPHMGLNFNTISVLGRVKDEAFLRGVVNDCVVHCQGIEISDEEEAQNSANID
ncbi:hypothetical protein WICMUC_000404 [Wickerhamomyces mucosus]|uniref:MoaB/Mog domain-containing protein n=1 Tax=Wickerhamomyces mucosus TaxID=1378264 RepID=A0A9P8PZC0_9ASCO|nr:hypothetical protein WICMUC_000404 [Wickerhamomyces mucosus]